MEATEQSPAKRRKLDPNSADLQQDPASAAAAAGCPAAAGPASEAQLAHNSSHSDAAAAPADADAAQQQHTDASHADGVAQAPQGDAPAQQQQQQPGQQQQQQQDPGPAVKEEQAAGNPAGSQQQQQQQQPVSAPVGAYTQREEHLMRQEASGEIEFAYVLNDGQPINMIRLMGLKVIFSKQLPNMPREYICRLLLDRRHRSCALVGRNGAVLGGITYRVFPQQGLGEIAFCAVAASQQVRGFGTRLMNHAKAMARDRDGIRYFLTYADNNAVGYFKKQGFTREITLPRDRWVGFIKDYDGGTLMEAVLHPKLPYTGLVDMFRHPKLPYTGLVDMMRVSRLQGFRALSEVEGLGPYVSSWCKSRVLHPKLPYTGLVDMFRVQKEYLDSQIRQLSNSHVVQAGIQRQRQPMPGPPHMRVADLPVPIPPADVPGVKEAGWTPSTKPGYKLILRDNSVVEATPANLHTYMEELLAALVACDDSWPFRAPVDPAEALDYYDIIADPVDLLLIGGRLASKAYYASLEMFAADVRKMCDNCKYYNAASTPYYQCAVKVQSFMDNYLDATVTEAAAAAQQQQQ
ncbi:hypothetical protein OEZ85_002487 [Tetradesmus obliquus]|uniref:histone acetyltransferase n=1 Tax=Tetradesmus obliquus TaxID=3088 RepID=A0ABY8TY39_TETOB|nr:hypothetical protein OEZ85_002487 [Tetradesmus obliquus]